ncbi:unnamed protein product (macronuclear) [Paramecium tetraurelia]|uniref:AAA+ ATPase domain-containing protein n=1 Tax=Paramecium tetraurelia TaxID=5888 RepID=A0DTY6_PARTE|nr:uncharacterized protein GSPATT00020187001 [Paramecium tetraurelia]CAK86503.1 unnamed protein product [Paramecium tetraurelia]|eukprot:XP_001453900.1 hypothetical protein (macronuclear) [Paramecium tetraurelia strain d4-2]
MSRNIRVLDLKNVAKQRLSIKAPVQIRKFDLSRIREQELEFKSLVDSFESDQSINSPINGSFVLKSQRSLSKKKYVNSKEEQNIYGLKILTNQRSSQKQFDSRRSSTDIIYLEQQQEKSNLEWLEHCKEIEPPQAKCQFFHQKSKYLDLQVDSQYFWEDVAILDLDIQQNKFIVQKYPGGQIKKVDRLSLQFVNQNQEIYQKVQQSNQQRQLLKKIEHKKLQQIMSVHSTEVSQFPKTLRQKLFKKYINASMTTSLLDEISSEYIVAMKKCAVGNFDNKYKFIPQDRYQFYTSNRKQLKKLVHFYKKSAICAVQNMIQRIEDYTVYTYDFRLIHLPLKLEEFNHHIDQQIALQLNEFKNQRLFMLSNIQDCLSKEHSFVTTQLDQFKGGQLDKLLTKINYIYLTFLKKQIEKEYYILKLFLKQYTYDDKNEIKIELSTLLELSVKIIIPKGGKMSRKDIRLSNVQMIKQNDPIIYIQYSLNDIIEQLLKPCRSLLIFVQKFQTIRSELMTLLLLKETLKDIFDQKQIHDLEEEIIQIITMEYQKCYNLVERFQKFKKFLIPLKSKEIAEILGIEPKEKSITSINKQQIVTRLQQSKSALLEIDHLCNTRSRLGLFSVNLNDLKFVLKEKVQDQANQITNKIIDLIKHNTANIKSQFDEIQSKSSTLPNTEEKLVELKLLLGELKMEFSRKKVEILQIGQMLEVLNMFYVPFDFNLMVDFFYLKYWPQDITELVQMNKNMIEKQEKQFLQKLQAEKYEFEEHIYKISELFTEIKTFHSYEEVKHKLPAVRQLNLYFDDAKEMTHSFHQREGLFGLPNSTYPQLDLLISEFQPYQKLWELASNFEQQKDQWLYGSFKKLNSQDIQIKINDYVNQTIKMTQYFKDVNNEYAQQFLRGLRAAMERSKEFIWIIEALVIEAFQKKPSFWRDLFRECHIANFDPKEDFPLQILITRGILNVKEQVLAVSQRAEKGWNIEKRLNEMQDKLSVIVIEIVPYKDTYIFKNYEEVQMLLDEQLNVLGILKAQPHVKMVLSKANQLEYKTVLIQDTLEYGMKCQKHWIYLDPIFTSEDIKKKLAKEAQFFRNVDQSFKMCMENFNQNRKIWECIDSEKMKVEFSNNVLMLDQIQKSLTIYLESKRVLFPRFYFVSDEELVEILAQTKEPVQVQRHIYKCFESIQELKFEKYSLITGFYSSLKECVPLEQAINVAQDDKSGNVELWLQELETQMKKSISRISNRTLKDLNCTKQEFITKWPTQSILLANQIKWTRSTETAIRQQQKMNLKLYLSILHKELQDTVLLVRSDQNKLQTATLEAMVVIEVHQKDIVDTLYKKNVQDANEFVWISQMRFYNEIVEQEFVVNVKMVNSVLQYGFEYLGNLTRLVITKLTDRCQRTLLSALNMNYGGAPEGPAGTGKTETVKDLAKAIGMPCIVFNCSEGLNYIAMGKFFKGLASSGSWCCFDEFNRLDPEVLSVVAQQIYTIFQAVKEKRKQFNFEGVHINLTLTVSINITMNPGYAGRSELPDNLQILFRPCAMVVPDYAMIAEIYLYSTGFEKARELSQKIVTCLRLCNEQLSSQEHYDFGMRALKAILSAAKNMYEGYEEEICLTAIINVNKPKFIPNDVDLFMAITKDLFPDIKPVESNQLELEEACSELNCQMDKLFLSKIEELQNNINVRNGVMCIGETFSGKTTTIQVLAKALNCQIFKLNPKSINTDQLYGFLDPDTRQWSDGVAPILIRENIEKPQRIWIHFDGPVDSLWIENLNTVLDDNQKLCLTSGEILKIPTTMCMVFEVEDLSAASPATVSRCGMIYYIPFKWPSLIASLQLPNGFDLDYFIRRMRFLIDHTLAWTKLHVKFPVMYIETILVSNFINLTKKCLTFLSDEEKTPNNMDNMMIFALVWSVGAAMDEIYRPQFSKFINQLIKTNKSDLQTIYQDEATFQFPNNDGIDYFLYCFSNGKWVKWINLSNKKQINPEMQFHQIVVQTQSSIRNDYLATIGLHMLYCGPTGTGKTLSMAAKSGFQIVCSGSTTGNSIQRLIETKINKRRRKGYYASEEGHIFIFIDDLNMPYREPEGAQPAIELLRQWMEMGGWYDLDNKEFKYMCDITFLGAMQPNVSGRNQVTKRFLRFFNILYIGGFDNESMTNMLEVFIYWLSIKIENGVEFLNIKDQIIVTTLFLFEKVQTKLLPTPSKSHYIYTVRDIFKIFQGMSKVHKIINQQYLVKLWCHECARIFSDRLVDMNDLKIYNDIMKESLQQLYPDHLQHNLFLPLFNNQYEEAPLMHRVLDKVKWYLEQYNYQQQQYKMELILFTNAILHVARISRILLSGHALLIGMGGSGRTSLSKLANFILFQQSAETIDSKQWDENLLTVLKDSGMENRIITLIFQESQFHQDYMLEDICNIMTHGEVSHLFPPEERIKVQEELPYSQFIKNCKHNMHIILCMQPIGETIRKRLRSFPAIINSTTIDWFMSWSDEALESTAFGFLKQNALVKVAVDIHHKVLDLTDKYKEEMRRYFYVTPTQYLQMLKIYQKIYEERVLRSRKAIDRMETGIEKILHTEQEVDKIRNMLFELQPQLEKATNDNQILLKKIKKRQQDADQKRMVCEQDEKECSVQREEANSLRNLCQTQLNNVIPLLKQATDALEKISREDMILLKSFIYPPPSAAIVMEGLCYAFEIDDQVQSKNKDPPTIQDFWDFAKKNLLNDKLIKRIKKMKLEEIRSINIVNIEKLEVFSQNPLFERDKVFNASTAAGNLSDWIRAVLNSYQAVEIIEPKKQQLAEAEVRLKDAEEKLGVKRSALDEVMIELKRLSNEYQKARIEKEQIEQKVESITIQLQRAEKLTNNLSDEKVRWKKKTQKIKAEQNTLEGDSILCSALISYMGVFPIQYRENAIQLWQMKLLQEGIQSSSPFQLQKQLSDPLQINKWLQQKLPNDQFSIDNAIILKQSSKWPLIIDPQLQANQWIRNMEDSKSLLIFNARSPIQQVQLQLEHAIQIGYAVLVENVTEDIDPLFIQILSQKDFGSTAQIKFFDKVIEQSNDFRFYLTTKLDNPHYQPQICVMVTLLNFQATLQGLTDQMLNVVVKIDEPVKEELRIKNIFYFISNQDKLIKTEDQMLELLSQAGGDLLQNETIIIALQNTKDEGNNIEERIRKLETDSQAFNVTRQSYQQVAETVANLYFVVYYLATVEPTYLWSLDFYVALYSKAIKEAQQGKLKRNQNIIDKFILMLYNAVNRSLLEKDKLIFRFLLCQRLMNVPINLVRTSVMGCSLTSTEIPMPKDYSWLTYKMWLALVDLQQQYPHIFKGICDSFSNNKPFWDHFYTTSHSFKNQILNLDQFQINMIVKIIKPEQFIQATNEMIRTFMGQIFLESIPITFEQFYLESDQNTPLLCVTTPGADPRSEIIGLAHKYGFQDKLNVISLGQGQSQLAIKLILKAIQNGNWVLLQNCHLAASFMPELEKLYENQLKQNIHTNFRLWLTTLPTNLLPQNVIIRALKMTYELPRGIKNNMLRSYLSQDPEKFELCKRLKEWKNLFFSLALLHACLLERKKYGPLGWNIGYNFSQHDLEMSKEQILYFLDQNNDIPWDALHYLIAENNYGGRVTDPVDRKLLNIYVSDLINKDIVEGFSFNDVYKVPSEMPLKGYIEYIATFPIADPPQLFGLHPNAEIYSAILDTENLSSTILQLLPRTLGDQSIHPDKLVQKKGRSILNELPAQFNISLVESKYPLLQDNSMHTLIQQEVNKYNKLISQIFNSLEQLMQALEGYINMTDQLNDIYNSIFDNKIPSDWSKLSYLTTKPLGSWFSDLLKRIQFLDSWINNGEPTIFWLGSFFFIQGFLTAVLQNYSRKSKIPIDQLKFDFEFMKQIPNQGSQHGIFIEGLSIDGAQFDLEEQTLLEPDLNILFFKCPIIKFIPTNQPKKYNHYSCPLYNTSQRKGVLTSNGLSINFICNIKIPIKNEKKHWSKRGVALIIQID